jgi:hypothetical protein
MQINDMNMPAADKKEKGRKHLPKPQTPTRRQMFRKKRLSLKWCRSLDKTNPKSTHPSLHDLRKIHQKRHM